MNWHLFRAQIPNGVISPGNPRFAMMFDLAEVASVKLTGFEEDKARIKMIDIQLKVGSSFALVGDEADRFLEIFRKFLDARLDGRSSEIITKWAGKVRDGN